MTSPLTIPRLPPILSPDSRCLHLVGALVLDTVFTPLARKTKNQNMQENGKKDKHTLFRFRSNSYPLLPLLSFFLPLSRTLTLSFTHTEFLHGCCCAASIVHTQNRKPHSLRQQKNGDEQLCNQMNDIRAHILGHLFPASSSSSSRFISHLIPRGMFPCFLDNSHAEPQTPKSKKERKRERATW